MALNPIQGNVNVDTVNRLVVVEQRQPLAINPDRVTLTFDLIKTLAANIILMELGALPLGSGDGKGGEGPAGGGEGHPSKRVM